MSAGMVFFRVRTFREREVPLGRESQYTMSGVRTATQPTSFLHSPSNTLTSRTNGFLLITRRLWLRLRGFSRGRTGGWWATSLSDQHPSSVSLSCRPPGRYPVEERPSMAKLNIYISLGRATLSFPLALREADLPRSALDPFSTYQLGVCVGVPGLPSREDLGRWGQGHQG